MNDALVIVDEAECTAGVLTARVLDDLGLTERMELRVAGRVPDPGEVLDLFGLTVVASLQRVAQRLFVDHLLRNPAPYKAGPSDVLLLEACHNGQSE